MFSSRFFAKHATLSNFSFAAFSLLVFFYLFFSPSLATPAYPQDTFFILSDGLRFANGQVPYRDYHSALGPLSGLVTGLGVLLCPPGSGLAHGALIGQGLFLLLLLPATVFLAYRRLRSPYGALFCFLVVSLLASRVALGDPSTSHLTITGTYNAQGYALLLVFGLTVLLRPQTVTNRIQLAEEFFGGILLLAMFFDKLSYFGAGISILAAAVIIPKVLPGMKDLGVPAWAAIRISAFFVAFTVVILVGFGISPTRVLNDMMSLVFAQSAKMGGELRIQRIPKMIFDAVRQYAVILFGFPLLLCLVHGKLPLRQAIVLIATGVFLLALSIIVMMGNSLQAADMFLLLLFAFVMTEIFSRRTPPISTLGKFRRCPAFLILFVLQHQAVAVLSTVRAAGFEFRNEKNPNRWLVGTGLGDLVISHDEAGIDLLSQAPSDWALIRTARAQDSLFGGDLSMYELSQIAHDGKCLLEQNLTSRDRVFTDGYYPNIFALMLSQPPPTGGSIGFSEDFTKNLSADDVRYAFVDTTLIMTPRQVIPPLFVGMRVADGVMQNFVEVGQIALLVVVAAQGNVWAPVVWALLTSWPILARYAP